MQDRNEAAYHATKSTSVLKTAAQQSLGIADKPAPVETSAKPPSEKPAAASKPPTPASNGAAAKAAPPSEKASNNGAKSDAQKLDKFISK